jgi:inosose dehydratase
MNGEKEHRSGTVSRRDFVRSAAISAAGVTAFGCAAVGKEAKATPLVGSSIYGWTQYAQRDGRPLDVPEVMTALKDCGYDYLEGFMNLEQPDENARFADQLRGKGLHPHSIYSGATLHDSSKRDAELQKVLAAASVCGREGFKSLSCNPSPVGREKTIEELDTQASALNELGRGLARLGMKLGVHQHLPEMASKAREFHHIFENTDPALVRWCYDVHWVWKGGVAPLEALKRYGDRVLAWHLRQSRNGIWWETLDTGEIDYAAVAKFARKHRLPSSYTVELAIESGTQVTRSAVENHSQSRKFVKQVFGV